MKCDSMLLGFGHSNKISRLKEFFVKNGNRVTPAMFDAEFSKDKFPPESDFCQILSPVLGSVLDKSEWAIYLDLFHYLVPLGYATIEGNGTDLIYSLL